MNWYAVAALGMALILLVDASVLWLGGREVPEVLTQLVVAVFAFYFGRVPGRRPSGPGKGEPPRGGAWRGRGG